MNNYSLPKNARLAYATLSILLFLVSVSGWVQRKNLMFDRESLVSFHDLQYGMIFVSGIGLGIAVSASLRYGVEILVRNVQVSPSLADIHQALKRLAWGSLVVSMCSSIIWTASSFNLFVDRRVGLMIEVDMIVLLMGLVSGASWLIIFGRRVWLGLIISLIMIFMLVGDVLTRFAWQ